MTTNPDNNAPKYEPRGRLVLERTAPHRITAYFIPGATELDPRESQDRRVKLLVVDSQNNSITTYPTDTRGWADGLLKPKYDQIKSITIADSNMTQFLLGESIEQWGADEINELLGSLPAPFVKDYNEGLGIKHKEYRFIIHVVETISDCSEIVIVGEGETHISLDGKIFYITKYDLKRMRLDIDRIRRLSQASATEVKTTTVHNILAERLGIPKREPNVGRHPFRKLFTDVIQGKTNLSKKDQNSIIRALSGNANNIASDQPEKLAKLRADIELVTLEKLIKRYQEMMKKPLAERLWQSFFKENPFVLGLAFGHPVIKVGEQISVGGGTFSGSGNRFVDFLFKNSLTDNAALVEIKTPRTVLLNKRSIREGIYTPSTYLSGAINQALDQKYHLQRNIVQLQANSNVKNFESYSVRCYLIIGTLPFDTDPTKSAELQKSFELCRGNSKDVEIVTFDELLESLKELHRLLSGKIPSENP